MAANSQSQWNQHINGSQHIEQMRKHEGLQNHTNGFNYDSESSQESSSQEFSPTPSFTANYNHIDDASNISKETAYAGLGSEDNNEQDHANKKIKLSGNEESSSPSKIINYPTLNSLYYSPTPISTTNSNSKFSCTLCNVPCNSQGQLQAHLNSKGHLTKMAPAPTYHCTVCNQAFNSASQLNAHFTGKKHQEQAAKGTLSQYPHSLSFPFLTLSSPLAL